MIKESPSLAEYKKILVNKEMADKGWAEAVEKAVQTGFDRKGIQQSVEVLEMVKTG